ncbi:MULTISPECIES: nickel/cobalt transporter [unclassified Rhizobium]|uniref:nickel/cobalt transporter n=1 Tax=unclassified Rhizobium TaxID=2613769 RepID=UPI00247AE4DF|nr:MULTISPECIES: nickel/cobalt transporter [unclassified Rhizobium]MDH7804293.1 nickel/cobalt exporter [Rhizobium sp. AN70]
MLNRSGRLAEHLTIAALCLLTVAGAAHAQSPLGIGSAEPSFVIGGPFAPLMQWINVHQQMFYRALTGALKAMREDNWAMASLVGLSFAYGVFHAAGPGHGKAVISSYMIANETQLKRGILISFISALIQGAMAIGLVAAAWLVLRGTSITMTKATQAMEIASFAMVALFGAWLLLRKLWSLRIRRVPVAVFATTGEATAVRTTGMGTGLRFQGKPVFADHDHNGTGDLCVSCGKSHAPDPQLLKGKNFSLHEAWSAIIAVGLRPCSGAIIVMSFALLNGIFLGGVLSVLAMSLGTAITVSLLAIMAVSAKGLAVRFAGPGSRKAAGISHAIEIAGALFVLLMGLMLLGASLQF